MRTDLLLVLWKQEIFNCILNLYFFQKFKVTNWAKDEYGNFYNGDSYIILNVSVSIINFVKNPYQRNKREPSLQKIKKWMLLNVSKKQTNKRSLMWLIPRLHPFVVWNYQIALDEIFQWQTIWKSFQSGLLISLNDRHSPSVKWIKGIYMHCFLSSFYVLIIFLYSKKLPSYLQSVL